MRISNNFKVISYFRVKECKISEVGGDRVVYPIHSFDPTGTCTYDSLAVQQTYVSPNIEIAFRSFRFRSNNNEVQFQKVSCNVHLDPVASFSAPSTLQSCTCYSPCECGVLPGYEYNSALYSCLDINECESSPCPTNSDCINNEGSYECLSQESSGGDSCQIKNACKTVENTFALQYDHQLVFDNLGGFPNR